MVAGESGHPIGIIPGKAQKGTIMSPSTMTPTTTLESLQPATPLQRAHAGLQRAVCTLDARLKTVTAEPEKGAATAEYAVVLVAATAFAGVLLAIIKSGPVKTLLTKIIQTALNVG